jgi:glycosyltransferase 2 family protein
MRPSKGSALQLVFFLAGAAALIGITLQAGIEPVMRVLATLKLGGLALVTLVHLPVIALMGLAWWFIGRPNARASAFVIARLARDAVAEVLPFSQLGGFVGGVRVLVLSGSRALDASLTLFADLMAEFGAKLFYTLAGLLVLGWLLPNAVLLRPFSLALTGAFLAAGLFVLLRKQFRMALNRLTLWAMHKALPAGDVAERDFASVFTPAHILPSFAVHAICWMLGAAEAWVTFKLMGIDASLGQALVVDSLGTAFRTLGFLVPGALGIQEAGYVIVCALFGITPAQAIAFSLTRRARDIVIGLGGLGLWQALEIRKAAYSGSAKL